MCVYCVYVVYVQLQGRRPLVNTHLCCCMCCRCGCSSELNELQRVLDGWGFRVARKQKMGNRAWEPLLRYDQLRRALRFGEAFPGFREPGAIAWPPTYRRRKSKHVIVHDYSVLSQVSHGYTLSVKKRKKGEAFDAKKQQRSARTPSWTDRVLVRRPMEWPGFPLEDVEYTSVDQVRYSDHAPVRAVLRIKVRAQVGSSADGCVVLCCVVLWFQFGA